MADIRYITYKEFKAEYAERLRKDPLFQNTEIRLYEKGCCDESDQDLIINTNEKYFQQRCNHLLQDFLIINITVKAGVKMIRINVEEAYRSYLEAGWNYLAEADALSFAESLKMDKMEDMILGNLETEKLIIRPINYNDNKYQLKDAVYWLTGDIALVLYLILNEEAKMLTTVKMQKLWLEKEGIKEEEALDKAFLNTNLLYPPRIHELRNFLPSFEEGQLMNPAYTEKLKHFCVYRLTTTAVLNGAVAAFYPGVQEKIAELMGGDYFVGFSSMHEVMIQSVQLFTARNVREAIKAVNSNFSREDFLTNKIFRYYTEKGRLELV